MEILGISVIRQSELLSFLASQPVSQWRYETPISLTTAIRRALFNGTVAQRLRSYCYKPRVVVVNPPGHDTQFRMVHEATSYATNLVWTRVDDGNLYFLIVFESKVGRGSITANFPTGITDQLEKTSETATRETLEETGLVTRPSVAGSCFVWASRHKNPPDGLFHAFFTLAHIATHAKAPIPNRGEIVTMAWLPVFDVYRMMESGQPIRFEIDAVAALQLTALRVRAIADTIAAYHNQKQDNASVDS